MISCKRISVILSAFLSVAVFCAPLPLAAQEQLPAVELKPTMPEGETQLDIESDAYILGPGDVISITDMTSSIDGKPNRASAPVLPDGTASIYPIGLIRAGGKSLRTLTEEVRLKYSAIAKSPDFTLGISETRPVEVYVVGEVVNPGRYRSDKDRGDGQLVLSATPFAASNLQTEGNTPQRRSNAVDFLLPFSPVAAAGAAAIGVGSIRPQSSQPQRNRYGGDSARILSPTTLTATTALQLAGGVKETADIRHIQVRRRKHPPQVVDLWAILVEGDVAQDVILKSEDVVVVPKGTAAFQAEALGLNASQSRVVRVFGAVRTPGIYELAPQDDVLSIISRAGGFTETAIQRRVTLSRKQPTGQTTTLKVSIRKSMRHRDYAGRQPLVSGDVVEVRESFIKKTAPKTLTIAATFLSAFLILYFSRRIVDESQPRQQQATVNLNNAGPLGLPSVF